MTQLFGFGSGRTITKILEKKKDRIEQRVLALRIEGLLKKSITRTVPCNRNLDSGVVSFKGTVPS